MSHPSGAVSSDEPARGEAKPFAELRRHNAYKARVARLLESRRGTRIEHVMLVQRKHRIHQAR